MRVCTAFFYIFLLALLGIVACDLGNEDKYEHKVEQAGAAFDLGNYQKAATLWQEVVNLKPQKAEYLVALAQAHIKLGSWHKARQMYEKALSLHPERREWWFGLGKLCTLLADTQCVQICLSHLASNSVALHLLQGDALFAEHKHKQALDSYLQALQIHPQHQKALIRSAFCFQLLENQKRAKAQFEKLMALPTLSFATWMEVADYWRFLGKPLKAEETLLLAAKQHPNHRILKQRLIELYMDQGRFQKALQEIESIQTTVFKNLSLFKMEIECLLGIGDFDRAEKRLLEVQKISQDEDPDLVLLQGKLCLLKGCTVQAVNLFERAADMLPWQQHVALYFKGLALLRGNKMYLAEKAFIQALALDPTFTQAELALAGIQYVQNDVSTSLKYVQRIIHREPENAQAYLFQGVLQLAQGKARAGLHSLGQARILSPELKEVSVFEAVGYERLGQARKAFAKYKSTLDKQMPLLEAVLGAIRLGKAENLETLKLYFQNLAADNPQEAIYHYILGLIHKGQEEWAKAVVSWQRAIALKPNFVTPYLQLAANFSSQGKWDQVITWLERGLDNGALSPQIFSQLAQAYRQNGEARAAIDILEQGVSKHPEQGELAANLAWMYMQEGHKLDRALGLARKAYSLCPDNAAVADTLGWAFYQRDLVTRAVWLLEHALQLEPEQPLIHYHLGLAWQAKGQEDKAGKALQQALKAGLGEPERGRAEQFIHLIGVCRRIRVPELS